jgi:hypothetical protein
MRKSRLNNYPLTSMLSRENQMSSNTDILKCEKLNIDSDLTSLSMLSTFLSASSNETLLFFVFLGLGGHILELRKLKTNYTNQLILYIILLCEKTCELLRETLI